MITISSIQIAVAQHYRVRISSLRAPRPKGDTRKNNRRVCRARQVAMNLSWRMTDLSGPAICKHFGGRDHSTLFHAVRVVDQRRAKDRRIHHAMRRLTLELIRGDIAP